MDTLIALLRRPATVIADGVARRRDRSAARRADSYARELLNALAFGVPRSTARHGVAHSPHGRCCLQNDTE